MEIITIEKLLEHVKTYNEVEIPYITKAYEFAKNAHSGQKRQSGEDYIHHPLAVAYILSEMHADKDTVCAGILHDVIEDTDATHEEIEFLFNKNIANLVSGVTKLANMNYSTDVDMVSANTRKIISSIKNDVRIIIVKLADRLHNMRTIEYTDEFKIKRKALETMEIFVPLAYHIGAYRIKSELEDISLKQLKPELYEEIKVKMDKLEEETSNCIDNMIKDITNLLEKENMHYEIKRRTKNIYGVYERLNKGEKINTIHDLLTLKIMVDDIPSCYRLLGLIHSLFPPLNNKFRDYIAAPKTNMYQSLHTTVFGYEDRLVQVQIRTFDMDNIASFGLTSYWNINKGDAKNVMKDLLEKDSQFFKSLTNIDEIVSDNSEFVKNVKGELFAKSVYVYTTKGKIISLPDGSTPIDFAYKIHTEIGDNMTSAFVNDEEVALDYILKKGDRVKILVDKSKNIIKNKWYDIAKTTYAKRRIKDLLKSK